jgi:hypothetical protein
LRSSFLPKVGGRLLSLRVDGRELLWQNPWYFADELRALRQRSDWPELDGTFSTWANIGGSKTWPAPQGWEGDDQWAGPPDPILDSGAWSWAESEWPDGGLIITMTSPDDPRTGLRVRRHFVIPAVGVQFNQTMSLTNTSPRTVTWAAWEVCQVRTAPISGRRGVVRVPVSGDDAPLAQGDYHGVLTWRRVERFIEIPAQEVVAKRGFANATGSVSWSDVDGAGLELRFTPEARPYPDGGARVEVWMQTPLENPLPELSGLHPDAHLAELEVLGPLTKLAPGQSTHYGIRWVATSPGDVQREWHA